MASLLDAATLLERHPSLGSVGPDDVAATDDAGRYALVRLLPFDSDILGAKAGRVVLSPAVRPDVLGTACDEAASRGFAQVVATVDARDRQAVHALEQAGFSLVDVAIILRHTLGAVPLEKKLPDGMSIRPATEADIPALRAMQGGLFRESRFYADPDYTQEQADEVFRRWIENCVRGRADVVFIAEDRGQLVGFFTCKVSTEGIGGIDLVGVSPEVAGRGVGRALAQRALSWFAERASEVRVKTQVINVKAAALYTASGFRLFESDLTYRRSLGGERLATSESTT